MNERSVVEFDGWETVDFNMGICQRRAIVGEYILRVQVVTPSELTQWRNRSWAVYWQTEDASALLASGYCNGTEKGEWLALSVVEVEA